MRDAPYLPILHQALAKNPLPLTAAMQEQLCQYLVLLKKWNNAFNLTAIDTPLEMVYLHLIDSLTASPYLHGTRLLDVGTGAGLPGIPLAIMLPQTQWVLLDKNNKKIRFITQVIAELGLKNVTALKERCEDFPGTPCFDTIITRAFSSIPSMLAATEHLLCQDGCWVAMKGQYPSAELQNLPVTFTVQGVHRVEIKGMTVDRHMVCIKRALKRN